MSIGVEGVLGYKDLNINEEGRTYKLCRKRVHPFGGFPKRFE